MEGETGEMECERDRGKGVKGVKKIYVEKNVVREKVNLFSESSKTLRKCGVFISGEKDGPGESKDNFHGSADRSHGS